MKKSLKMAILIPTILVLIIGIVAEVFIISSNSSKTVTSLSDELVSDMVSNYAYQFKSIAEGSYGVTSAVTKIMQGLKEQNATRDQVVELMRDCIYTNEYIFAVWTCWEANTFDGKDAKYANTEDHDETGRFAQYVYKKGDEIAVDILPDYRDSKYDMIYGRPFRLGRSSVTDPYWFDVAGKDVLMYSIIMPITDETSGKVLGIVGTDIYMADINEIISGVKVMRDGYLTVISPSGLIATYPDESFMLKNYKDVWLNNYSDYFETDKTNTNYIDKDHKDDKGQNVIFSSEAITIGDTLEEWTVCAIIPQSTVNAPVRNLVIITIIVGMLLVFAVGITVYYIINSKFKPIMILRTAANEIAAGNLNVNLPKDSQDEIGSLTRAFNRVKSNITALTLSIGEVAEELDNGNTDARINEDEFKGAFKDASTAVNDIISSSVNENNMMLEAYGEFGKGNFNVELRKFPGKKAVANEMFDELKENLIKVSTDVYKLINAAANGNLNERVDVKLYHGDWRVLTEGLNNLVQSISVPIDEANEILSKLSQGDFNVSVGKEYKGSFASMMDSFENMVESTHSYITEITEVLEALSEGDLRVNITRQYVGQYNNIKDSINHINATLRRTIEEIRTSADSVLSGAKQISESSMELANGVSMQASSIEELNASVITINEKTTISANKSHTANEYSRKSMQSAHIGNEAMTKMLKSMNEIKETSNSISNIIKVIDDIAFQTNILALNAAVEAARAGAHGKGFAVVAEEVRSLASRSQNAAHDTTTLIEGAITKINYGTETAKVTADSLNKIVDDTNSVSNIINDIYESTKSQAEEISQITSGVGQISQIVQNSSYTSQQSAATAEELNSQSDLLAQMVSRFKI